MTIDLPKVTEDDKGVYALTKDVNHMALFLSRLIGATIGLFIIIVIIHVVVIKIRKVDTLSQRAAIVGVSLLTAVTMWIFNTWRNGISPSVIFQGVTVYLMASIVALFAYVGDKRGGKRQPTPIQIEKSNLRSNGIIVLGICLFCVFWQNRSYGIGRSLLVILICIPIFAGLNYILVHTKFGQKLDGGKSKRLRDFLRNKQDGQ